MMRRVCAQLIKRRIVVIDDIMLNESYGYVEKTQ